MKTCETCIHYDGAHCTALWNNMEPDYYIPERDDKEPEDSCDCWEKDSDATY